MVTTRRNQPAAQRARQRTQSSQPQSDPELAPEPTVRTPRTSRRKATGQTPAVATKRRLRSSKDGVSPLRALPAPAKSKRKKTPVHLAKEPVTVESDSEAHADSDTDDRTRANHEAPKDKVKSIVSESDRPLVADTPETSANKPTRPQHAEDEGNDTEPDAGEGIFFSMRKRAPFLFAPKSLEQLSLDQQMYEAICADIRPAVAADLRITDVLPLQARIEELKPLEARVMEQEWIIATLRARVVELEQFQLLSLEQGARIAALESEMLTLSEEHEMAISYLYATGYIDVNPATIGDHETATPPLVLAPKPSIEGAPEILQGSERAIELLKRIEDSARPRFAGRRDEALQKIPAVVSQSATQEQTPRPRSFFGRVFSALTSPFSSRSTHSPSPTILPNPAGATRSDRSTPVQPQEELTLALTPTPTPVGERSIRSKTAQNKNHRHAVIKAIVKAVRDPDEQRKAEAWAQSVLEKIPKGSSGLGEKRKRIESGVRMGDLKHIPGQKPWVSTGYGMDDDIFDLSDSDDAPAWAVLRDMELDMERSERPTKKRKSTHNIEMDTDDIRSLNDTSPGDSSSAIFNSGGNSASLHDLRPRSSRIGSPMFDTSPDRLQNEGLNASIHENNAPSPIQQTNTQPPSDQSAEAENRAAFERELRRSGHVPGSNAWCVPEHSSDEESEDDTDEDAHNSALWTQQPPPAPTPAHASLPTPVAESPATPAAALDPIELQRARIAKHTPAKPSRLREVQVPSPSLRSDAGSESMTSSIFAASVPVPDRATDTYKMTPIPDAEPLDLPPEVRTMVEQYFESNEGHDYLATVSLWDDPVEYDFSDIDEA